MPLSTTPTGDFFLSLQGSLVLGGAEISAFDPASDRLFVTSSSGLQVVNLANPAAPTLITTVDFTTLGIGTTDVTSVAVKNGSVAVALPNADKSQPGKVVFLSAANSTLLGSVDVGALPDMLTFTPDGTRVLVANEGEVISDADFGGEGSVSIIDISGGVASASVQTAGFTAFNGQEAVLRAAGVRIFAGQSVAQDLEPEYIAISADGTKAMVTLQEANAVAILDIATATFTDIVPLGMKDFSGLQIDTSDRDGAGNSALKKLQSDQPVFGLYMPDAIDSYQAGGETYYVIANEGDDRDDFLNPDETIRVGSGSYDLDDTAFPNETALKTNAELARLTVSNAPGLRGDTDGDGDIDQILMYGARSFSILDSDGDIVFDSADIVERVAATLLTTAVFDDRSDNKGPEPEGIEIGSIDGRTYAFVGLERAHMTLAFDITDPANVTYTGAAQRAGDLNPEGQLFISAADSPTGEALLVVSNEVSSNISIFEVSPVYTLQLLHYYGESGLLGITTAPIMGALIDRFDDDYANTLVLAEGDSFIPGPWLVGGADPSLNAVPGIGATALGRPDIAIMNAFGTDASALGNYEFDLGSPVLQGAIQASGAWVGAQFPFITANLNFAADSALRGLADATLGGTASNAFAGQQAADIKGKIAPYAVVTQGGERIGLIGITTFELLIKSSPNGTVPGDDGNPATTDLQEVAIYVQAAAGGVASEAYPVKPVRMVVPLAPGGGSDIVGRIVAQALTEHWGQAVVVDNRPGAGGTIGNTIVANSPPDGYTLLVSSSTMAISPSLYRNAPSDILKDFQPLTLLASQPSILAIHTAVPAKSVKELIALMKAQPGNLRFGSAGSGTASHLANEQFAAAAGVSALHVPYKSAGLAASALLSGEIQFMVTNMATALPQVKSGRLKGLAVTGAQRAASVPELPTVAEAGLPGYEYTTWYAMLLPVRTPRPLVARIYANVVRVIREPQAKARFVAQGLDVHGTRSDEFAAYLKAEVAKWSRVIQVAGLDIGGATTQR